MEKSNKGVAIVKSSSPIMDGMKDEIVRGLMETILPKIKPLVKPAAEKLENYLGDNERFIVVRRASLKNSVQVLVFNSNGDYVISNGDNDIFDENGERIKEKLFNAFSQESNPKSTVEQRFNIDEFINKFLSGNFK